MADTEQKIPKSFDWKALTSDDSPKGLPDLMSDPLHQDLSTAKLDEGDVAHDFELPLCDFSDGSERETGRFGFQPESFERAIEKELGV